MSQPRANRYIRQLLPVLAKALDALGVMPERKGPLAAAHERQQREPKDLIIDGVERRRQPPKQRETQAIHYSGKQKTHSDKNLVVVNTQTKRVSFLSRTLPGSVHDKKLADQARISYRSGTTLRSDLGLLGYAPLVRQHLQPKKTSRRSA